MNGFTDVRLYLKQQELDPPASSVGTCKSGPAGMSRWALICHRWVTRRQLLALSASDLADVGLTAQQQREEGLKPFWRE
ncbi:DUF1127 domain-containing protein [Pseudomonas japonica]|uniref:DUF1127 domain-containing protein n=1 Tax=Pseudomonas japonica TaxID=256466 RepID=UPI0015E2F806|nr:DUF1127 domain-containing protein [Pseudomonas japonica]MBA1287951.1 DUF1127 domain-containing protein [Pseudomonas japonica]